MKNLSTILITVFCMHQMYSQTTFYLVTFEDGDPNASTYTADVDIICRSSEYFARVSDLDISTNAAADYIGEIGSKYWAGETHDDVDPTCANDGAQTQAKSIVFGPISISGKSNLAIRLYIASNSSAVDRYECDDRIDVSYSIDGGGAQTAFSFRTDESPSTCAAGGTPESLRQDKDLNGTGDAGEPALGQTFQQFLGAITGTGSNITVTVTFDNDASTEEMAIDHLELIENSALPVELVDFKGSIFNNQIRLDWKTASELNNYGFEIQKSPNGLSWKMIGFVEGKGASSKVNEYHYYDSKPLTGLNYFRLKQIDFDETSDYSKVIVIKYEVSNEAINVFPNPSNRTVNIQIDNPSRNRMKLMVSDHFGRNVWQSESIQGVSEWREALQFEKAGMYVIAAQIGNKIHYERVVIMDNN